MSDFGGCCFLVFLAIMVLGFFGAVAGKKPRRDPSPRPEPPPVRDDKVCGTCRYAESGYQDGRQRLSCRLGIAWQRGCASWESW